MAVSGKLHSRCPGAEYTCPASYCRFYLFWVSKVVCRLNIGDCRYILQIDIVDIIKVYRYVYLNGPVDLGYHITVTHADLRDNIVTCCDNVTRGHKGSPGRGSGICAASSPPWSPPAPCAWCTSPEADDIISDIT